MREEIVDKGRPLRCLKSESGAYTVLLEQLQATIQPKISLGISCPESGFFR